MDRQYGHTIWTDNMDTQEDKRVLFNVLVAVMDTKWGAVSSSYTFSKSGA
jgi:hypothetical protein